MKEDIRIALVPLDDRPCNLKFPQKLAAISGAEIITPPAALLGHFTTAGDCEKIIAWMKDVASRVDFLIASVEMVAFGGLIASRRPDIPFHVAQNRIRVFRELKGENFNLSVYPFSLILRSSPSPDLGIDALHWKVILKYSELVDRAEASGRDDEAIELEQIKKDVPKDVLSRYLLKREVNHEINKKMLQFVSEGFVDYLVVGEDDVMRHGLHRRERRELEGLAAELAIEDKTKLICGADEVGMMLVARSIIEDKVKPKVFVVASDPASLDVVPIYEDKELLDSVNDHVGALGGEVVGKRDKADVVLFLNTPYDGGDDLYLGGLRADNRSYVQFIKEINDEIRSGRAVAVADVAYANGADPAFMKELLSGVDVSKLSSFAAWNTASNSIGSALAQAFMKETGDGRWEMRNKTFLLERFVDDYLYQTELRQKIKKDLIERGGSINDLGDQYVPVDWVVKEELKPAASEFAKRYFKDVKDAQFNISLPWPRIFEADVDVKV